MPKLVTELAQGNTFSRSSENGSVADEATRVFKVILESPDEALDIFAAIGVSIGDVYTSANPIPCVRVEGRADGESRLVRIITAQYRATAGDAGGNNPDPKTQQPDVRPANFSTSTSLYEAPAYKWYDGTAWVPITNPVGDVMDGITKMEAITTIRVTQFQTAPGTIHAAFCGYVNSAAMTLGPYMTCQPKTVLFRGVEANPVVESFGGLLYRGFNNVYEFAYRANYIEGLGICGWDSTPPLTGFNVKAFTPNFVQNTNDNYAVPLKHDSEGKIVEPLALAAGVTAGQKVRAHVIVSAGLPDARQNPSASPVPLNEDGTPRSPFASPPVLVWRRQVQPSINLTTTLGLRLNI